MSVVARYIGVNGIKTFYEESGREAERTIVCFHAEGRETRQFHRLMRALSPAYRVIAFDMPAHGKSWPVEGKRPISDWEQYLHFAQNFLETLDLRDPILLGCGLGAAAALELAARYGAGGVVAINGAENAEPMLDLEMIDHPYISTPHLVQEYNRSVTGRAADADARELIRWQAWCETGITLKADLRMLNAPELSETLKKLRCPVLLVHGADDWTVSREETEQMLEHLACEKKAMVELPDTGRFAMIEQPELIAEKIQTFFMDQRQES